MSQLLVTCRSSGQLHDAIIITEWLPYIGHFLMEATLKKNVKDMFVCQAEKLITLKDPFEQTGPLIRNLKKKHQRNNWPKILTQLQ